MNKSVNSKAKYCIQWETHSKYTIKGLCSLMEHQSLVDIAICCGNNTLHAHKCILAANSPLFREAFEKNSSIEQVVISGCEFSVIKAIIEVMYCGETTIPEEYAKYLVAAAKLFQMKGLENLFSDRNEYHFAGDEVSLPQPHFLTKKPKYPTAFNPLNYNPTVATATNILKPINYSMNDGMSQRKLKRKYIRAEAEKACAKEAQASRMALANLQKEIANAPQVNSFIIEDSCTETTVENFIPHTDENFADKLNELQQIQVMNYSDLDSSVYVPSNQYLSDVRPHNMVQFTVQNNNQSLQGITADKIKHILGQDVPSNVEIMFKTSEGNFVSVTDEVLQNISKGGLQYQVVDENGHVGEIRELQVLDTVQKAAKDLSADAKLPNGDAEEIPAKISKIIPEDYINPSYLSHLSDKEGTSFEKQSGNSSENFDLSNENISLTNGRTDNDAKSIDFVTINENIFSPSTTNMNSFTSPIPISCSLYAANNFLVDQKEKPATAMDDGEESPKKPATCLKFSPDMFFADMPIIGKENVGCVDDVKVDDEN